MAFHVTIGWVRLIGVVVKCTDVYLFSHHGGLHCLVTNLFKDSNSAFERFIYQLELSYFLRMTKKKVRYNFIAVKHPVSGHPRDQKKCLFKRGVCLWEVKM